MTNDYQIPDFSGDDFSDDKEIQKKRAAEKAYEKMVTDVLSTIRQELKVQKASHINFKSFHMFRSLTATTNESLKSTTLKRELRVSLVGYFSSFPIAKSSNSGTDQYLFGHIVTKNNYPRSYFHKETLKEKVEDLFLKRDVDFAHSKKFSRNFQVLTEDKIRLQRLFQFKQLDILTDFPDMEVEFLNNSALYRNSRKSVSIEEAFNFCEMTKALLNVLD